MLVVRWAGHDASGDTWEPLDNLTNYEEAIVAFERATSPGRSLLRRAPPPPPAIAAAPSPLLPPPGRRQDSLWNSQPPGDLRAAAALVRRMILYWWPRRVAGWQRGTVAARLCPHQQIDP